MSENGSDPAGGRYRRILDAAIEGVLVVDDDRRISYVNDAAARAFGLPPEELLGRDLLTVCLPLLGPADREFLTNRFALRERPPARYELTLHGPDAPARRYLISGTALYRADGTPDGSVALITDITERNALQAALHDSERRLQLIINQLPAVVVTMDTDLRVLSSGGAGLELHQIRPNTSVGRTMYDLNVAAGRPDDPMLGHYERAARGAEVSFETEWGGRSYLMHAAPMRDDGDAIVGVISVSADVTELKAAQQRYRLLAENSTDVITTNDPSGVQTFVSPAAQEVFGYAPDDMVGHSFEEFLDPEDRDRMRRVLDEVGSLPEVFTTEVRFRRKDGITIWVESTVRQVRDASTGGLIELEASSRDVTARVRAMRALENSEARLQHRAAHDSLTGLPNRDLLVTRLEEALARGARAGNAIAVLFIDIDNFKYVNDSLGHHVGDLMLTEVGTRIAAAARTGDVVARFGGDEYVVVCEPVADPGQAQVVAERICARVNSGIEVMGHRLRVTISVGIALGLPDTVDANELLRNADLAMYRAKQRGRDRVELFDATLSADARRRLKVENELRDAVDAGQLLLHYQPVTDLTTDRVVGVEALLRWQHPVRGLLNPPDFLDVAESSGLIIRIGAGVLVAACEQGAAWLRHHPGRRLTVAVNVSLHQLAWGEFVRDLDRALEVTGFDPTLLRLELTETALLEMTPRVQADLHAVDARGVQIGIDDFGTGYSSLAYLKQFPVRFLKVDKAFIDGLGDDAADTAIVDAILRLGAALSLETIAEGVETAEQLAWLRTAGCSAAQGYHLGHPMAAETLVL